MVVTFQSASQSNPIPKAATFLAGYSPGVAVFGGWGVLGGAEKWEVRKNWKGMVEWYGHIVYNVHSN